MVFLSSSPRFFPKTLEFLMWLTVKSLIMRFLRFMFIPLAALAFHCAATADTVGVLPQEDVLGYLGQLVQWQRDAAVIEPANSGPREEMFQDTVRQNGLRALKAGFTFARAEASIAPAEVPAKDDADSPQQRIQQRAVGVDQRIVQLRKQLHGNISAGQRQQLEGQLKLAQAEQELFETVQANFNAAASGGGMGFGAKIGNLQRSVPELLDDHPKPAVANDHTDNATPPSTSTGLLSLSSRLFETARKQRELKEFIAHTSQVEEAGRAMLKTLHTTLDTITAPDAKGTADERVADFKQVAGIVAPLAEANVWVSSSKAALNDWNRVLGEQFAGMMRQFGIRLALLLAMLAVPIVLGEVAERTIDRYVRDPKRGRQAHTVRRVLVAMAVVFILMLNFISDFGSFATFAGFLTAGLAVALQGVLMSLVAHFMFYGRYGVRAGDRVNVAGVTGDIVQIGMVRFYLRELHKDANGALSPTGKIVAFPNSILFQPSAFYKYV